MDSDEADLLAHFDHLVDSLGRDVAAGAHGNDDVLRILSADVIERLVRTASQLANLIHDFLDDRRGGQVVLVGSLTALEVDVRVLSGAAQVRMLRIQRAGAELSNLIPRHDLRDIFVSDLVDLLDLVRGTEAVEEVQERHGALQGRDVSDERHVLSFLNRVGSEHRETGLAASHNVGVIAKDGQSVVSQRTSGNMEDAREQLAGDLVHVRDHEQQALGSSVGGGQSTGLQRAMHSTSRASLGLHLGNTDSLSEQVLAIMRSPVIRNFRHRGRRGDREDRGHIAERIRDMADSSIAVNGHFLNSHWYYLPISIKDYHFRENSLWTR